MTLKRILIADPAAVCIRVDIMTCELRIGLE